LTVRFITPSNIGHIPIWFRDDCVAGNPEPGRNDALRNPEVQCDTVDDFHLQHVIDCVSGCASDWNPRHADKPFFLY
jgi:hypothetical protein